MAATHTTYVKSKDGSAQIEVALSDELHRLCWGKLHTSNRPHEGLPMVDADPAIWIAAERVKPPVMVPFDRAGPYAESATIRSETALAGAVAKIEAAFGKGSIVPASRMEAAA